MANYNLETETTTHLKGMSFSEGGDGNTDNLNSFWVEGPSWSQFLEVSKFIDEEGNTNVIFTEGGLPADDISELIPESPYVINKSKALVVSTTNGMQNVKLNSSTGKFIIWTDRQTISFPSENRVQIAAENYGAAKLAVVFY